MARGGSDDDDGQRGRGGDESSGAGPGVCQDILSETIVNCNVTTSQGN